MIKKKFWLKIICALAVFAIPLIGVGNAFAASTGTVDATVEPQNISVTVSDGDVSYGTVDLSSNEDTTSGGVNESQTATNNGNVNEDFNITSTDASGGTGWTLASSIGADQYKHSFCIAGGGSPDPCDSSPTWTAITSSGNYHELDTGVSDSGTSKFDLKIDTPSSVSDYVEKSITVTVQAVIAS